MTKEEIKQELLKYGIQECKIPENIIFDSVHEIVDELDHLVNQRIMKDFANKLNSHNPDLLFKFKTEFIFKALYFVAKKKYGFWVLEQEGKKVNEIGAMNIGKKSDYPILTNQMVVDLLHQIFYTNCDKEKIIKRLEYWQEKFEKALKDGSFDVGLPVSWQKEIKELKSIPVGVKGMVLYNILRNDKIFDKGSKGFLYYIKDIDWKYVEKTFHPNWQEEYKKLLSKISQHPKDSKFLKKYNPTQTFLGYIKFRFIYSFWDSEKEIIKLKVQNVKFDKIAIPIEDKKVPDWIQIDTKTMLDKVFHDKYSEILSVIGLSRLPDRFQMALSF